MKTSDKCLVRATSQTFAGHEDTPVQGQVRAAHARDILARAVSPSPRQSARMSD